MTQFRSKNYVLDIPMPDGSTIGITEELSNINTVTVRRTVNGEALVVQSPFARKARFKVTASGIAVRAEPAFLNVNLGDSLTLNSSIYRSFVIRAGQSTVTLPSPVVPLSRVIAERVDTAASVKTTYAGTTITLADGATDGDVIARARMQYSVVLVGHTCAAQEVEGTQTWSADYEER